MFMRSEIIFSYKLDESGEKDIVENESRKCISRDIYVDIENNSLLVNEY